MHAADRQAGSHARTLREVLSAILAGNLNPSISTALLGLIGGWFKHILFHKVYMSIYKHNAVKIHNKG